MADNNDFKGNTATFSATRLTENALNGSVLDQFTRAMHQTAGDTLQQWPDAMNPPREMMSPPGVPADFVVPMRQFAVMVNGQFCGAFDLNALTQLAAQGQFTAQCMVWKQGMAGWQAAGSVRELAPLFAQAAASPPPSPPPQAQPQQQQAVQFNLSMNGQTFGPFDLNALAQMAGAGQINAQSQVWRQGMAGWQTAGTVPELAPLFAQAGAPPPPPPPPPVS